MTRTRAPHVDQCSARPGRCTEYRRSSGSGRVPARFRRDSGPEPTNMPTISRTVRGELLRSACTAGASERRRYRRDRSRPARHWRPGATSRFGARQQHCLRKNLDERADHRQRHGCRYLIGRKPLADVPRCLRSVRAARRTPGNKGLPPPRTHGWRFPSQSGRMKPLVHLQMLSGHPLTYTDTRRSFTRLHWHP